MSLHHKLLEQLKKEEVITPCQYLKEGCRYFYLEGRWFEDKSKIIEKELGIYQQKQIYGKVSHWTCPYHVSLYIKPLEQRL